MENYLSIFLTPKFNNKLKLIIDSSTYEVLSKKLKRYETKLDTKFDEDAKTKLEQLSSQFIPIDNKNKFFEYFIKYFTIINDTKMVDKIKELKLKYKDVLPEASYNKEDKLLTKKKKLLIDEDDELVNETISVNDFYWLKEKISDIRKNHNYNNAFTLDKLDSVTNKLNQLAVDVVEHFNVASVTSEQLSKILLDFWNSDKFKHVNILVKKLEEYLPVILDEEGLNVTGNVDGYDTPNAFGKTISVKKLKSSGYIPLKYDKKNIKTFDVMNKQGKLRENKTVNSIDDIKLGDIIRYHVSGTTGNASSRYQYSKGIVKSINKNTTDGSIKVYDDSRDRLMTVNFEDIEYIITESNLKSTIKSIIKEVMTEQTLKCLDDEKWENIQDEIAELKREYRKSMPAASDNFKTIKAVKEIAKKYKCSFKEILSRYTPSNNIQGDKSWDKNGNIIIQK